jgi:protein-S-isoprenylcysteine O-methyltransferase Ste14
MNYIQDVIAGFKSLPAHGMAAVGVLLLYAVESEIRFGKKARTMWAGPADRWSTIAVALASAVPVLGFIFAMRGESSAFLRALPLWLRDPGTLPGMPLIAWTGVGLGVIGVLLRLWALLTLRQRYTRTLRVDEGHLVERGAAYKLVRHPGYLGSLLCLNGLGLASGNLIVFLATLVATIAAYTYRIRVEEEMLVTAFGASYERYQREVPALLPLLRRGRSSADNAD